MCLCDIHIYIYVCDIYIHDPVIYSVSKPPVVSSRSMSQTVRFVGSASQES